jgi:hypothetical protein
MMAKSRNGDFHGDSTGISFLGFNGFNGILMECTEILMGFIWDFNGISIGFNGNSMGSSWVFKWI